MSIGFDLFGHYVMATTNLVYTTCTNRLACWHVEGEPGLENYEVVIRLTRKNAVLFSLSRNFK
jgi:hypothetical protein